MQPAEVRAVGDLAAEAAGGLTRQIHDIHGGIAERVFGAIGEVASPVRVIHDRIAGASYWGAGQLTRGLVRTGALAASIARSPDAESIESRPFGRLAVGALNGAFGDAMARRGNALALGMAVRAGGRAVELKRSDLTAAYPTASPRVAVFLHGLCETEYAWRLRADQHPPYGERLRTELGYTPVYVRYNSGRHISSNGRELAAVLAALHAEWPVQIDELALVGHSMGGLIARSACHYGAGSDPIGKVRHVFALGAPHHGAQLERVAHAAGAALNRLPETRAVSRALGIRSVGIRDLYNGYLVDEDWQNFDPDAFLVAAAREIPFLATANHYFVAATLTRDPEAPAGRAFGDLLVSRPSAWAHRRRSDRLRFPIDNYRSIGGANHFDLLNHPAISEQLARWIAGRPALPAPAAT